jgi:hypothetical protein
VPPEGGRVSASQRRSAPCPVCEALDCPCGFTIPDTYRFRIVRDQRQEANPLASAEHIVLSAPVVSQPDPYGGGRILFAAGDSVPVDVLAQLGVLDAVRANTPNTRGRFVTGVDSTAKKATGRARKLAEDRERPREKVETE